MPPDTGEHTPPQRETGRPVLDLVNLHTLEGCEAELTPVVGYIPRWFTCPISNSSGPDIMAATLMEH